MLSILKADSWWIIGKNLFIWKHFREMPSVPMDFLLAETTFFSEKMSVYDTRSVNLLYWFLACKNANIISAFCGNNLRLLMLVNP